MGRRKANLIARLEGETDQALVLHNHIDVDPIVDVERWKHPPFSGAIDPPWIYGRGAFDMKSVAIAQLRALVELERSGVRPRRSVVFLATSGEETGGVEGTAWLLAERSDLLGGSWAVLTEGGVVEARTASDIKYWGTENGQKRYIRFLACSRSRERLEALSDDLRAESEHRLDHLRVLAPVKEFLRFYAPSRDMPAHRELLSDPESTIADLARFTQLPDYQKALFRDEIGTLRIGQTADGRGWFMPLTAALLPDADADAALERLLPAWMTHGIQLVRLPDDRAAPVSPIEHPVFIAIGEVLEERYGKLLSGPFFQSRSTNDARLFRAAGIPSYGFSPFLVLSTDTMGIGGLNEGIALPAFIEGVDMYVELVRRLAGGETERPASKPGSTG
jgi:acetylornithine deacetylase/succinyl-diaminopimelate desuccinylase-like protein